MKTSLKIATFLTLTLFIYSDAFSQASSDYDRSVDFTKYKTYSYGGWQKDSGKLLNDLDKERLHKAFKAEHGIDFPSLFVKDYYSHEIHDRKPDLRSYEKVIELSGIKPEDSIFIDDLEKNIIGAQQAGLKTFWLKDGMEMTTIF